MTRTPEKVTDLAGEREKRDDLVTSEWMDIFGLTSSDLFFLLATSSFLETAAKICSAFTNHKSKRSSFSITKVRPRETNLNEKQRINSST